MTTAAGRSRDALRDAAGYAIAGALQRALLFLLLPAFTHALTPAEYGAVSVAISVTGLASMLLGLAIDVAIFRMYFLFEDDPARQTSLVQSTWRLTAAVGAVGAIVFSAVAFPLVRNSGLLTPLQLSLSLAAAGLFVAATTVPLATLRAERRLAAFLLLNAVAATSTAGFTAGLVIIADMGTTGWLVGTVAANAVTLLAATVVIPLKPRVPFSRHLSLDAVRYSLPVLPHFASIWALNLADRHVLATLVPAKQLGLYTLAANLAVPLTVLVQGLNQGFMPNYARAGSDPALLTGLRHTVGLQASLVIGMTAAVALLAPVAIYAVIDPSYAEAVALAPWLVVGTGLLGLYYIPMNGLTLTLGRTKRNWVITVFAALTSLALLPIAVPIFGIAAAAGVTAFGYLLLLVGMWLYSRRVGSPLEYPWLSICGSIALASTLFVSAQLVLDPSTVTGAIGRAVTAASGIAGCLVIARAAGAR